MTESKGSRAIDAPQSSLKRKATNDKRKTGSDDSSDESDIDLLDVDFEWFDPQEIDFHGLKTLVRQLFDVDNDLLDLSGLVSLVLSQPLVGSTVKIPDDEVETSQTDPYAFLTVLNLREHRENPAIQSLIKYFASKSREVLPPLFSPESSFQIGLILSERFINMPPQIVPPMYNMLLEEISWALAEKEPYAFTHYLIVTKTYVEVASKLDAADAREDSDDDNLNNNNNDHDDVPDLPRPPQPKRAKKSQTRHRSRAHAKVGVTDFTVGNPEHLYYFHPEDEIFQQFAFLRSTYEYTKQGGEGASDAKRVFQDAGIRPMGQLLLIEAARFQQAVDEIDRALSGGTVSS